MAFANKPNSPRQKMINLMYLVFIAMMTLNVSSEVLDGFELVEDSLQTSIESSTHRNRLISGELAAYYDRNPEKAFTWYDKSRQIADQSDQLVDYIQDLKVQIVREADGKKGDPLKIKHKDNLDAASKVMLAPVTGQGKKLKKAIEDYRVLVSDMVNNPAKVKVIEEMLHTKLPRKDGVNRPWENTLFENMPVAASITLLTKLQSDVRYSEGEVLSHLLSSIDMGDYRVNQVVAQVVPNSQIVMRGGTYEANIVLSAIDSTKRPHIVINGNPLNDADNGVYRVTAGASGSFPIQGYIELSGADGPQQYPFESEYYVTEPTATVAPTLMNVLYAGYDNPIQIAVPGVPSGNVTASMTNGTLSKTGDLWNAQPATPGSDAIVTVHARMADGRSVEMAKQVFKVRALPDPLPYIEYTDENGLVRKFRGGRFSKRALIQADGIQAAIDDDLLKVNYSVLSFELTFFDSMGNAMPEASQGATFTQRQKDRIRNLPRGKRFYITRVLAKGPDGIERVIPQAIEVIVN